VFITPGNHDYLCPGSPYEADGWPENVHIFKNTKIEEISVPELSCKIYGAGYTSMDCPALLKGFQAVGEEVWHLGIFHGDVENAGSPYFPITREQIRTSALSYLASGHIHKGSSLRAGETLCAWPGCPMGRGYDELGTKGVILVTLDDDVKASFLPLSTPRFYDEEVEVGDNAKDAVAALLPALHTDDFYRITLTGYSTGIDLSQLSFPQVPNLILRDETRPEIDLWRSVGEDSLEGVYFGFLQQASQSDMEKTRDRAALAARISRQILDGQEVKLP
ncbi:MAG: DNA repair exonuclease, partial [Oscillospiraceae bacterium]|nr:DNA repair exonuclease [Oscillospiraceae bacterium]